jgi:predicted metal-dependent enzyme (double-stranded beta helix superfamily)
MRGCASIFVSYIDVDPTCCTSTLVIRGPRPVLSHSTFAHGLQLTAFEHEVWKLVSKGLPATSF